MAFEVMVDPETLRTQVKEKYREVAMNPRGSFHFHTGRSLAARLGYDESVIASFHESAGFRRDLDEGSPVECKTPFALDVTGGTVIPTDDRGPCRRTGRRSYFS